MAMAEENKEKVTKRTKETFHEFLAETSMAALPHIVKPCKPHWIKIIWICVAVCAFLATFTHLTFVIWEYFSYPVREIVSFSHRAPVFPSVTVCKYALNESVFGPDINNLDYTQFVTRCEFYNSFDRNSRQLCNKSMLRKFSTSTFPSCYTVSVTYPEKIWRFVSDSFPSGLILHLYVPGGTLHQVPYEHMNTRIHVQFHEPGTKPEPQAFGISIRTGTSALFGLTQKRRVNLPKPHSNCTLRRELKYYSYNYSIAGCIGECMAMKFYERFRCFNTRYDSLPDKISGNIKPCQPDFTLSNKQYMEHLNNYDICRRTCPEKCDYLTTKYSLREHSVPEPVNSSEIFALQYIKESEFIASNELSELQIKWNHGSRDAAIGWLNDHVVYLYIYFESFEVETLRQEAVISVGTLFANIGGTLGLYIGISLMTFVELFILMIKLILLWAKKSTSSKKKHEVENKERSIEMKDLLEQGQTSQTQLKVNADKALTRESFDNENHQTRTNYSWRGLLHRSWSKYLLYSTIALFITFVVLMSILGFSAFLLQKDALEEMKGLIEEQRDQINQLQIQLQQQNSAN